tara:strand:+ start:669 stop:1109 length:441 start_codon:yes stop_codon:yes gene_type:complete
MKQVNYFFEGIENCNSKLPAKKWIKGCVTNEGYNVGCLNFIFCSDEYLQAINKKYLNKSYLTDVISFQQNPQDWSKLGSSRDICGDIFISIDRVRENKLIYKTIFGEEIKRVMIHGVLHLLGYNDKNKNQKEIMRQKESFYIKTKY